MTSDHQHRLQIIIRTIKAIQFITVHTRIGSHCSTVAVFESEILHVRRQNERGLSEAYGLSQLWGQDIFARNYMHDICPPPPPPSKLQHFQILHDICLKKFNIMPEFYMIGGRKIFLPFLGKKGGMLLCPRLLCHAYIG